MPSVKSDKTEIRNWYWDEMPKLSIFVPCERVILGNDGSVSLIGLVNQLTFPPLPPNIHQNLSPGNIAAPVKWAVFAQFHREQGDIQKRFLFQTELRAPSGVPVIPGQPQLFLMKENTVNLNILFPFFPMVPAGIYDLMAMVKGDQEKQWTEVGRFPIVVAYAGAVNPTTKGL